MKHIVLIFTFIYSFTSFSQEKQCTDVRNGTFKYFDTRSNEFLVKRTDSIQIDSSTTAGVVMYSKIKWKSNCEYQITIYKVNDTLYNSIIGNTFAFEILEINKNKIKLKTSTLNKKRESEYEMEIID